MKATWLPDLVTVLTFEEAASALRVALRQHLSADPSVDVLALALGKTALETGRWKAIHRHNFGNIKAGEAYEGFFTTFRCNEVLNGKLQWFDPDTGGYTVPPGHPQCRFRAYQSATDGAAGYIDFVAGGRYAAAWALLLKGDAAGYVHALKQAHYFTADEGPYLKGVASLQREFIAKLQTMPHEPEPLDVPAIAGSLLDEGERHRIETQVTLYLDELAHAPRDPEPNV
jgi:hypothetical protein